MQATIHPSLREKLDSDALGPFDVVIDFAQLPSSSEIEALGLELDGSTARGRLSREQILAIASFPQVKSINLTDQPVAHRNPEPSDPKLGASLQLAMEEKRGPSSMSSSPSTGPLSTCRQSRGCRYAMIWGSDA